MWSPWLGCFGCFVCRNPVGGHSELSLGRGANSSLSGLLLSSEKIVNAGVHLGLAEIGGGLLPFALICFDFHSRRPIFAAIL
ncbi:hypothetical protein RHMOL_Rhmol12G0062000 [Rhododendron molle]|uniref:Uncharacterized protein n=1 Tax=Rhododendron molle TaxID=49168 RepID=A0ACC0LG03_RHOML|nr:hypothetical protein RHMOL_Rhmol12G0062000 [Rhododendron molle]